jgi:xanthosine phosphorylase
VRGLLPSNFSPKVGIILGSGMGGVADAIQNPTTIPYGEIPGFPQSTVSGHKGQLVCGELEGVDVICFQGRVHLYEGIDPQQLRPPMYMLKLLGCHSLFCTAAVGSLRMEVGPGEVVTIEDHINMQMKSPLIGPNDPIGPRFPSLLDAYDPELREKMHQHAKAADIPLSSGVYLAVLGPAFETPAEIRAFKVMGADVVGMSTVPDVTMARHCGLRVAALGCVVNYASGMAPAQHEVGGTHITHEETLHFGAIAAEKVTFLFKALLKDKSWQS